jgi:simple sugar transport system ATP-binding protein
LEAQLAADTYDQPGERRDVRPDAPPPQAATLALEARGIDKEFYGVKANEAVDFELRWGEVHALLGENGAGKSTLCSVFAGLYHPDAGDLILDGEPVDFRSPSDALASGVGMVYQHFRLVENLTVAENLALGHPEQGFVLSRREIESKAEELAERYNLPVDPSARIWQLSVGEQQRVEILKMLYRRARILILDEPTAVLTPQESDALFDTVRLLAAEGKSIIIVSHKLNEIQAVADRVTVLRDGKSVGTVNTADTDQQGLAKMMVGRDLELPKRQSASEPGEVVLRASGVTVAGDRTDAAVADVSFELREGEIVGIAGVSGNGQRELAEGLAGLRVLKRGTVELGGDPMVVGVLERIGHGLSYVPGDRLGRGLAPGLTIEENSALKDYRYPPFSKGPILSTQAFADHAEDLIERFDIRGVREGLPIRLLSGGNLQKALVAREVARDPKVLIAASPTRGLDVGATEAVRNLLLAQRDSGVGVLMISEDLDEVMALSDRILVMFDGRIVGEVAGDDAEVEEIGLMMGGTVAEATT